VSSTTQETTTDPRPVDIATMRETITRVLPQRAPSEDPETLTAQLRGHIELIIPELEQAARKLPRCYPPRENALVAAWVARKALNADPAPGLRDLAYTLRGLCNRREGLAALEGDRAEGRPRHVIP
jgi:hypothetical protein